MRCPTFVVFGGCLVVAASVRMAGAQAVTPSVAIGAVAITVNGRSDTGKFQSVEGIALPAERSDGDHLSGRLGKPMSGGLTALRYR